MYSIRVVLALSTIVLALEYYRISTQLCKFIEISKFSTREQLYSGTISCRVQLYMVCAWHKYSGPIWYKYSSTSTSTDNRSINS